jgi:hypothetical protein
MKAKLLKKVRKKVLLKYDKHEYFKYRIIVDGYEKCSEIFIHEAHKMYRHWIKVVSRDMCKGKIFKWLSIEDINKHLKRNK